MTPILKAQFRERLMRDLAERLRKVRTLFLPSGIEASFEGYASVAEWAAAVAKTAGKLPEAPSTTSRRGSGRARGRAKGYSGSFIAP